MSPQFLSDYSAICEPRLRAFLAEKRAAFERRLPADLAGPLALLADYLLRGGKRLRGALVVLGAQAAGATAESVLDASVGMELLHGYLLIHDDFMDRDDTRRGGPTLHVSLGQSAGEHLGGSVAILLGSLCQAWAYQLIGPQGAGLVTGALEAVTLGQALDLLAPLGPELPPDKVLRLEQMKTGGYSFELPLVLGATLARAPLALLDDLRAFARPLGQAFQIADDLLGSFGAPEITGKPNASDLREGKRTMLVALALQNAAPADAETLRRGLGRPDADLVELREILVRSGAQAQARAEAERLLAESLKALEKAALPAAVSQPLRELADFAVRRAT